MTKIRKVKKIDRVDLDADGIIGAAIQDVVHDAPHEVHYDRAAEVCGVDRMDIPVVSSVAELLAFVLSVRAAGGNDKAMEALIDRFSPKAARTATDVTLKTTNAPSASGTPEEKQAAEDYMSRLREVS